MACFFPHFSDRAHALLWAVLPSPLSVRLPPRPLPDGDDDTSLIDALSYEPFLSLPFFLLPPR